MSSIIKIDNPYRREKKKNLPIVPGQRLAEIRCRPDVISTIPIETDAVIAINGRIIPIEQWGIRRIREDDYLLIAPRAGFDPGTQALIWSFLVNAAVTTAIAYGVGLLINSLSSKPGRPSPGFDDAELSQSFGWKPATLHRQGLSIPRFYGFNKMYGNVTAAHTEITGAATNLLRQYALISLGTGPYRDVVIDGTLKINDQLAENLDDVYHETRRGNLRQARISYFDKTFLEIAPGGEGRLVVNGSPITFETGNANFDNLEIDLAFPAGLYDASGGGLANNTVNQTIEIKKTTASSWQTLVTGDITDDTTEMVIRTYKTDGTINIERGYNYQVRATKNTAERDSVSYGDDLYLYRVREVIDAQFTYPRRALVGIKALATDQLSGTIRFSCYSRCLYVRVYENSAWGIKYSNNPAWVAFDILTQPVFTGEHSPWRDMNLLLNFEGEDAATSMVDDSIKGHAITFVADAQLDTAEQYFGSSSGLLDGVGDYWQVANDNESFDMFENLVEDWTLDIYIKHGDHAGDEVYCGQYVDANNYWYFRHSHGNGLQFKLRVDGSNEIDMTGAGEINDLNWYHVAIIKVGDEIGLYKENTQIDYVQMTSSALATFDSDFFIGQDGNDAGFLYANVDHCRVIKSNIFSAAPNSTPDDTITKPAAAYTDPGNSYAVARYDGYNPSKLNTSDFEDLADWCDATRVNPDNYTISDISLATNAAITTTSKHNRKIGETVLFRGVDNHGMVELVDGTTAEILSVTSDYVFTVDLDTSGYTAFDALVWLEVNSSHIDSLCGQNFPNYLSGALDGINAWVHRQNETHWFIVDLGAIYGMRRMRGRSNDQGAFEDDPIDVNIYISTDGVTWGAAVASGIATWQDTTAWVEIDSTDKDGRYIKVEIIDTEDVNRWLVFGDEVTPFTIFDVEVVQSTATVEKYLPRFSFNGGFDTESNMWKAAISVCELCRSMLFWRGNQISVTIDRSVTAVYPYIPVYAYTVGNIIEGSFKITYLPLADRASEIEAHYRDERKDFERTPFTLYNADIDNPTQKVRLDLFGITDADTAERLVNHKLLMNKHLKKKVSFEADMDAIGNTVGEVVKVQHDVTNWGRIGSGDEHYTGGGRIVKAEISGSDTIITIAGEIKFDDADWRGGSTTYKIMVKTADDIPPEIKTISGFTESSVPGGTYDITATGTFTTLPAKDDLWAAGVENLEAKDFRVTAMEMSSEKTIAIEGIEYVEAIYADD